MDNLYHFCSFSKKHFYTIVFQKFNWVVAVVVLISCSCKSPEREGINPNLVIIFPDEMRGQAMGFMGEEPVLAPNLDDLANESLVFTNAASNYPLCSPFRAMFMSGKYAHSNGVTNNCNSSRPDVELDQNDVCWSDILNEKGYSLGYIGKWHLDAPHPPFVDTYNNNGDKAWNEWCPPERRHGFDFWYAYGTYDRHMNPMYWDTHAERDSFHYVDQWGPEHEADMAIKYIKNTNGQFRQKDKPFALVVSMNPPHTPYNQVPQKYLDMYTDLDIDKVSDRPNLPEKNESMYNHFQKNIVPYYAMITGVDEQVGRILDAIEEEGIAKNTIFLFTADHGCCLGIHGHKTKNNPYEESMRIPFIIRWPGKIKPGEEDLLLSVPDYYPTLLDLLGYKSEIPAGIEGVSYAPVFLGDEIDKRPTSQLYLQIPYGNEDMGIRGLRTSRYTFTWNKPVSGGEELVLFDNMNDPYQLQNIVNSNPETVKHLKSELKFWLEKTNDPWIKHCNE